IVKINFPFKKRTGRPLVAADITPFAATAGTAHQFIYAAADGLADICHRVVGRPVFINNRTGRIRIHVRLSQRRKFAFQRHQYPPSIEAIQREKSPGFLLRKVKILVSVLFCVKFGSLPLSQSSVMPSNVTVANAVKQRYNSKVTISAGRLSLEK